MAHPARCSACKDNVLALLQVLYGTVEQGWASGWPCQLADVMGLAEGPALARIHASLVAHRGHAAFVRVNRLPRCDYYVVGDPGFIVEYDEHQHFTAPRALTLAGIPAGHTVAFDRRRWKELCDTIGARDNDPPYRDEQRAWYDLLRDLLPAQHGLGPTSRLLDRKAAYCRLDGAKLEDLETFRSMLNRP